MSNLEQLTEQLAALVRATAEIADTAGEGTRLAGLALDQLQRSSAQPPLEETL